MNRDDIIRMALEAGTPITPEMKPEDALAIAFALGKAEEREACARVCDQGSEQMLHKYQREGASRCAEAIRSRGKHGH